MSSDYEAASFLLDVLKQNSIEGPARAPFFTVVQLRQLRYERGRVLQAVVQEVGRQRRHVARRAEGVRADVSGYDRSQVLLLAASRAHAVGQRSRDAYIDAADRLSSYEQGQVMTALVKSERAKVSP